MEVEFFGETYTLDGCKPAKGKVQASTKLQKGDAIFYQNDKLSI